MSFSPRSISVPKAYLTGHGAMLSLLQIVPIAGHLCRAWYPLAALDDRICLKVPLGTVVRVLIQENKIHLRDCSVVSSFWWQWYAVHHHTPAERRAISEMKLMADVAYRHAFCWWHFHSTISAARPKYACSKLVLPGTQVVTSLVSTINVALSAQRLLSTWLVAMKVEIL